MLILDTNSNKKKFGRSIALLFLYFLMEHRAISDGVIVVEFSTEQLDANFATYRNQSFPMHMNMVLLLRKSTKEKYLQLL